MPPPGPPEIPTDRQSLTQRPKTDETKRKARGQAEECTAHAGARDGAQRPQAGGTERGARGRTGWGGTRSPQAGGTRRDALAGGWSGVRRPWAGGAGCKTSQGRLGALLRSIFGAYWGCLIDRNVLEPPWRRFGIVWRLVWFHFGGHSAHDVKFPAFDEFFEWHPCRN